MLLEPEELAIPILFFFRPTEERITTACKIIYQHHLPELCRPIEVKLL